MTKRIQYIIIISLCSVSLWAQQNMQRSMGNPGEGKDRPGQALQKDTVPVNLNERLWGWKLKDDLTVVDTIPIDTITDGFHNYDPIFKKSFSNIYLSNIGSPYTSELLSFKNEGVDFIFLNSFQDYFVQPDDITYYNTKTPYTNLNYINTPPKSTSEENFRWLFTQNVNKNFNVGFNYKILSSVGLYTASQTDLRNFNIHLTYKGPKYTVAGAIIYNKANLYENGGVKQEDYISNYRYYRDSLEIFSDYSDIFVNYSTQTDFVENFQFFIHQGFGIGKIKMKKHSTLQDSLLNDLAFADSLSLQKPEMEARNDEEMNQGRDNGMKPDNGPEMMPGKGPVEGPQQGPQQGPGQKPGPPPGKKPVKESDEEVELPVATMYHMLNVGTYKRAFKIDDLEDYLDDDDKIPLYDHIYCDTTQTRDTTRYTFINNTFQLKFNEEVNSLFKFGVRAFLNNEISHYKYQLEPKRKYDEDEEEYVIHYRKSDTTFVNTYLGGQIFKNLGKNFWWNAGGKFYFQGYKAGDMELTGHLNSLYPVFKDTAGIYANGKISLRSASYLQENYYSNHIQWANKNFKQEKLINLEAGLQIPTRRLTLSWESKTWTDFLYWNEDGEPDQTSQVISAFQVTLLKHFIAGPFHSNNSLAYQYSSNQEIYALPEFAGYTSNYFNFYLANKVLQVQIGFDVRYHTAYYAPAFFPATGQYITQTDRKYGNYPFVDAFINLHLKRARIFIKGDHLNTLLQDGDYLMTAGIPHEPVRVKWGVSWNFYD